MSLLLHPKPELNILTLDSLIKNMNRKKKVHAIFKKKLKKAKARMNPSSKPKYISKAERAKLKLASKTAADDTGNDQLAVWFALNRCNSQLAKLVEALASPVSLISFLINCQQNVLLNSPT